VPFLEDEMNDLRKKISVYETMVIFKDSSEGELKREFRNMLLKVETLEKENKKLRDSEFDEEPQDFKF